MHSKEYGRPEPVKSQLGTVKHERKSGIAVETAAIAPDQIGGIAH